MHGGAGPSAGEPLHCFQVDVQLDSKSPRWCQWQILLDSKVVVGGGGGRDPHMYCRRVSN